MNLIQLQRRVFIRLATERGSFVYNPEMGSELFKLTRGKNLQEVHDRVEGYVRSALLPEMRQGFVLGIENVRVISKTLSTIQMEVDVIANNKEILTVPIQIN